MNLKDPLTLLLAGAMGVNDWELADETAWAQTYNSKTLNMLLTVPKDTGAENENIAIWWGGMKNKGKNEFLTFVLPWLPTEMARKVCAYIKENDASDSVLENCGFIAGCLPPSESVPWLLSCFKNSDLGNTPNVIKSFYELVLKQDDTSEIFAANAEFVDNRLCLLWAHPSLMDNSFFNTVAYEAAYCIKMLVIAGHSRADIHDKISALRNHDCDSVQFECGLLFRDF